MLVIFPNTDGELFITKEAISLELATKRAIPRPKGMRNGYAFTFFTNNGAPRLHFYKAMHERSICIP